tara:strand:+ start:1379 stop:1666 length:288 start_codon:yes stop_codon:yes gene_type:complete
MAKIDKDKVRTLGKFMKNPIKYVANKASCISKGKKLGLSRSEAVNVCTPHYKKKGEVLSKLKSKPMEIRRSNKKRNPEKRNPEKEILRSLKQKRK